MPKLGPSEGSRRQMIVFLPMRLSASPRPMVVVVLPSPAGVGLIAVTRMSFPLGRFERLSRKSYSSLAMKRPNGCKADSGAPIFAAISAIGFRRAARAISMSDRMNDPLPQFRRRTAAKTANASSGPQRFASMESRRLCRPAHLGPGRRLRMADRDEAKLPRPHASPKRPCALFARRTKLDDPLRPDDRDDQRRDQGRTRLEARFRRGFRTAGVDEGAGRFCQPCRQAGGEEPLRRTR